MTQCKSCGKEWADHLGIQCTCAELQAAKARVAELEAERAEMVEALKDAFYVCEEARVFATLWNEWGKVDRFKASGKRIGNLLTRVKGGGK